MRLLEFPHSHFCEKARWALDFKGIPYRAEPLLPGLHMLTVRRYAPDTSVPVLINGRDVVQGSGKIIDYLEQKFPDPSLTPLQDAEHQECLEIESAMDSRLGKPIRQILYDRLLAYPDFIRYCFTHSMPTWKQYLFKAFYPTLRYKIHQQYVVSAAKVEEGRRRFDSAIDELEERLQHGGYLVGDRFTRADLSVASMLSLLVMPSELPFPWRDLPDSQARDFCASYQDRLIFSWVEKMYRDHRMPR